MFGLFSGFFVTSFCILTFWVASVLAADTESVLPERHVASSRHEYCFQITVLPGAEAPANPTIPAEDPQYLCMYASDLVQYPKSVVTFTLREKNIAKRPKFRYHYTMFRPGVFGRTARPDHPKVVFNKERSTVFLGFLGGEGKTYHYERLKIENAVDEKPSVAASSPELGRGPTSVDHKDAVQNEKHGH